MPITFNRKEKYNTIEFAEPPANAISPGLLDELDDAVEAAEQSEHTITVIRSEVDGVFSAGGDLKWFQEAELEDKQEFLATATEVMSKMEHSSAVFIAAIDGHCLAGGFEFALSCDIRLGSDDEWSMGPTEINIGAFPARGGTLRLLREVGRARAFDMIINGRQLSPQEAHDLGLVNELYDRDEFDLRVQEYAKELADGPVLAYSGAKEALTLGSEMGIEEASKYILEVISKLEATEDHKEAVEAFNENREPEFRGK